MKFAAILLLLSATILWADPATPPDSTSTPAVDSTTVQATGTPVESVQSAPAPAHAQSTPAVADEPANPAEANPPGYDEFYATSQERAIMSGHSDVISTEIGSSDSLGVIPDEMITKFQGGTRRVHIENTVFRREDPVVYDSRGSRDPFRALVRDEKKEGQVETDLLRLENAVLTGVVWSEGQFVAMLRDKDGNNFLLHEGDPIYSGRCTAITKSQAVFDVVEFGDYNQVTLKVATAEKPIKITG